MRGRGWGDGRAWGRGVGCGAAGERTAPRAVVVPVVLRPTRGVDVQRPQLGIADRRCRLARDLRGVGRADGAEVELAVPEGVVLEGAPGDGAAGVAVAGLAPDGTAVAEPCGQRARPVRPEGCGRLRGGGRRGARGGQGEGLAEARLPVLAGRLPVLVRHGAPARLGLHSRRVGGDGAVPRVQILVDGIARRRRDQRPVRVGGGRQGEQPGRRDGAAALHGGVRVATREDLGERFRSSFNPEK